MDRKDVHATLVSSSQAGAWRRGVLGTSAGRTDLELGPETHQRMLGFGGCFNELGWVALQRLPVARRSEVLRMLFDPSADGCRFDFCRIPIGASDYATSWYSLNETPGDYGMKCFSVARDRDCLIRYIQAAQALNPGMRFFASPWSPPTWMKFPATYNTGRMVRDRRTLAAYALYFLKFVQAYRREGIEIAQLHPQNEPMAEPKFPCCLWSGAEMADFIGSYLGPTFKRHGESCEIWLGTLNGNNNYDEFDAWANLALRHPRASRFIKGVGYQWYGSMQVQRTREAFPDLPMIQSENECNSGKNSWDDALHTFNLMRHYIRNGVNGYVFWNMVLPEGGFSSWGWAQNAMVSVSDDGRRLTYNPEFHVMRHLSRYVRTGAVRVETSGNWTANALAFRNADGETVALLSNPFETPQVIRIGAGGRLLAAKLPARSVSTIRIGTPGKRAGLRA